MGFQVEHGTRTIEYRRESIILYPGEGSEVWAYPSAVDGKCRSVELCAHDLLAIVQFFDDPKQRAMLTERAENYVRDNR